MLPPVATAQFQYVLYFISAMFMRNQSNLHSVAHKSIFASKVMYIEWLIHFQMYKHDWMNNGNNIDNCGLCISVFQSVMFQWI